MNLDLAQIAEIWRYGSVVRSWLLDLTADALAEESDAGRLEAYVADSGEGRWTVTEAIDLNVSAPVITESLIAPHSLARGEQLHRPHAGDHAQCSSAAMR